MFIGLQSVWRTQDNGGAQAFLEANCNEYTGTFQHVRAATGSPSAIGQPAGDLTVDVLRRDKLGNYVVAIERAPATPGRCGRGRGSAACSSRRTRTRRRPQRELSAGSTRRPQPERFVSGIAVDPAEREPRVRVVLRVRRLHARTARATCSRCTFNPATGTATWTDVSFNLGDQPITDVVFDDVTGDVYVSTDFTVYRLPDGGSSYVLAAAGLPTSRDLRPDDRPRGPGAVRGHARPRRVERCPCRRRGREGRGAVRGLGRPPRRFRCRCPCQRRTGAIVSPGGGKMPV